MGRTLWPIVVGCVCVLSACSSAPTLILDPATNTVHDERGFNVVETEHAFVISDPKVDEEDARRVGDLFEIGYRVVREDLGEAQRRPRLYMYGSEQQMYDDLVGRWGYSEWVRKVHTIPRMHPDYIEWVPPREYHDVAFITHEYSHRIIEQIAGLYSQINFKWFDEGLAQYEGQRALVRTSPIAAELKRTERDHIVGGAFAAHSLIALRDLTTEGQWGRQIEAGGQLAYAQAWAVVDYLVGRYGIDHVQEVLGLVGKGKAFGRAFEKVYGLTVEQAESAFRFSLALAAEGV